jgi:DnaJ like chaperone protein
MADYEKWLGAGLGYAVAGPIGGWMGYMAGNFIKSGKKKDSNLPISELEANLIVLASHLIKVDGKISVEEIEFVRIFLKEYFPENHSDERIRMLHHCLQKEYDLNIVCDQLRMFTTIETRKQIVRFMLDLAASDNEISERENFFIFKVAGYLNVNDIEYRKLKKYSTEQDSEAFRILGVNPKDDIVAIRNAYRKLILKFHPDRNKEATIEELKKLSEKLQEIKTAYEQIKLQRGIK